MKKFFLLLLVIFLFLGLGYAHFASASVDSIKNQQRILAVLSEHWKDSDDFSYYLDVHKINALNSLMNDCRNISLRNASAKPADSVLMYSVPSHNCNTVVRVYLHCTESLQIDNPRDSDRLVKVNDRYYQCEKWRATLILEKKHIKPVLLGNFDKFGGGNFSGIFMPLAFTHNNSHIILDAWMFEPGAGGGETDLGFDIIPVMANAVRQQRHLAPRESLFYKKYKYIVYLENSARLPSFSRPGPESNLGKMMLMNLTTGSKKKLLEESDTSYELKKVDELLLRNILHFNAIHYTFNKACPAEEDSLICAQKATSERALKLPEL